jgi:hypothetical protein
VLEAVMVAAEAVEIVRGGAAAFCEGDTVVDIGELGRLVAPGELAGSIAQADEAIGRSIRRVPVWFPGRWLVAEPKADPGPAGIPEETPSQGPSEVLTQGFLRNRPVVFGRPASAVLTVDQRADLGAGRMDDYGGVHASGRVVVLLNVCVVD